MGATPECVCCHTGRVMSKRKRGEINESQIHDLQTKFCKQLHTVHPEFFDCRTALRAKNYIVNNATFFTALLRWLHENRANICALNVSGVFATQLQNHKCGVMYFQTLVEILTDPDCTIYAINLGEINEGPVLYELLEFLKHLLQKTKVAFLYVDCKKVAHAYGRLYPSKLSGKKEIQRMLTVNRKIYRADILEHRDLWNCVHEQSVLLTWLSPSEWIQEKVDRPVHDHGDANVSVKGKSKAEGLSEEHTCEMCEMCEVRDVPVPEEAPSPTPQSPTSSELDKRLPVIGESYIDPRDWNTYRDVYVYDKKDGWKLAFVRGKSAIRKAGDGLYTVRKLKKHDHLGYYYGHIYCVGTSEEIDAYRQVHPELQNNHNLGEFCDGNGNHLLIDGGRPDERVQHVAQRFCPFQSINTAGKNLPNDVNKRYNNTRFTNRGGIMCTDNIPEKAELYIPYSNSFPQVFEQDKTEMGEQCEKDTHETCVGDQTRLRCHWGAVEVEENVRNIPFKNQIRMSACLSKRPLCTQSSCEPEHLLPTQEQCD